MIMVTGCWVGNAAGNHGDGDGEPACALSQQAGMQKRARTHARMRKPHALAHSMRSMRALLLGRSLTWAGSRQDTALRQ